MRRGEGRWGDRGNREVVGERLKKSLAESDEGSMGTDERENSGERTEARFEGRRGYAFGDGGDDATPSGVWGRRGDSRVEWGNEPRVKDAVRESGSNAPEFGQPIRPG